MSPRSLLFSSDQETSRLLGQALRELELNVDSCREIFAALRSLTSRAFDLILVDWDEGPEASFLLKTARELKSNQAAFVVVIGRADASAALQQAGADLVLSKPINADQTRHALLTSKEFVSRMKAWLPQCQVRQTTTGVGKELWSTPVPERQAVALVASAPGSPATVSHLPSPTLATLDGGLLRESFLRAGTASRAKASDRQTTVLRVAAIAVAFFAVGYVFSQPLTKAGHSVAQIFRGTSKKTPDWLQGSPVEVQAASESAPIADPETPSWQPEKASTRIRVTPARNHAVASRLAAAEPPAARQPAPHQNEAALEPTQVSAVVTSAPIPGNHIPESISNPFPGVTTARNVASKIAPALLDALEPITVPEQLSEKLLLDKVAPSYPQRALQAGLQGPVVLQAWIGRDGRIRDLKLIRGSLLLGQAACEAVKQWRYKPYLLNGQAVEAQTFVTVDFKIP
jgi:protein TonB